MAKKDSVNPVAYTTDHDVYVDGLYVKAGFVFVTNAAPEDSWVKRDPDEVSAIQASTIEVPPDVDISKFDLSALLALAAEKHVVTSGIEKDKKALITAIKAAQEPAL